MKQLIKFSKPNCVPCSILSNYLNSKGVEYQEVNPLDDVITGAKYAISSVPVLLVVDENGTEVFRVTGFNPSNTSEVDKAISMV